MNQDAALEFVRALYPSAGPHGVVGVCSSTPGQKTGGMLTKHFRTDDPNSIVAYAEAEDSAGRDVYLTLCAHAEDLGPYKRGGRAQKILAPGAWLDIDIAGPNHAATNLPRSLAEATEILQSFKFDPTLVIWTGGGLHCYWLFDAPVALEKNRAEVQKFLKEWQEHAAAFAKTKSWHVDNTSDMARVLRIPGTHNWKRAAKDNAPAPEVYYLIRDGQRYAYPILRSFTSVKAAAAASDLASLFGQTVAPAIASHEPTPEELEPARLSGPDAALNLDDEQTKETILRKLKGNRRPERTAVLEAFRDGKPWAGKGERDATAQRLASWLCWYVAGRGSIAAICDMAAPSLAAMEAESPEDFISEDAFEDKVARAMSEAREACDATRSMDERFRARLLAQGRGIHEKRAPLASVPAAPPVPPTASPEPSKRSDSAVFTEVSPVPPSPTISASAPLAAFASDSTSAEGCAPSSDASEAAPGGALPLSTALALVPKDSIQEGSEPAPGPAGYYTLTELQEAAEDQSKLSGVNVTVTDLKKLFLIQRGETFYVLQRCPDGVWRYQAGIQRGELAVSLPRDLRCLPRQIPYLPAPGEVVTARTPETMTFFDWEGMKSDGTTRKKTTSEILEELSTVARNGVIYDFTIPRSFYDPTDQTLHIAAATVRADLYPEFNPDVDRWLRTFGDTAAETDKFLDWVATLTKLDSPTSGLYLSGPKSAGKTMFALGCASLWNGGFPLEMSAYLSSFNAGLIACPVVFADEMLPPDSNGKRVSTHKIRKIVGDSSHEVRIKFSANCVVKGAIRAIFSANDENMLSTGDEDLGVEALAAVAGRFLHIHAKEAGAEFLRSLGGRHGDAEKGLAGTKDWIDKGIVARHFLWLRDNRPVRYGDRFVVEGEASGVQHRLASNGTVPGLVIDWLLYCLEKPPEVMLRSSAILLGEGRFWVSAPRLVEHWDLFIKGDRRPTLHRINKALGNLSIKAAGPDGELHREQINGKRIAYHRINVEQILKHAEESGIGDPAVLRRTVEGPSRNKFDKSEIAAAFGNDPTKKGTP